MKKILLSSIFALFCIALTAQQYSAADYIKAGNKALSHIPSKNFVALINFSKAIEKGETNPELVYNYALAAHNAGAFGLAESALEEYISSDEGVDRATALLLLAQTKHRLAKYDDAQTNYDLYLSEYSDVDPTVTATARQGKKSTGWAMKQSEMSGIDVEHLKREVNSDYADVSPFVYNDELYYSTYRFSTNNKQVNYAQIVSKSGGPLDGVDNFNIAKKDHITVGPSFSGDGNLMFYALCKPSGNENPDCQMYYSKKSGSSWSNGVKLPETINYPGASTSQANLVSEGDGSYTIYFASNRPGGKGGYDVWSTTMNAEMDFTQAINVDGVNTSGDDKTPYYHAGTKTLYFSSDGRIQSFGDRDIYKAKMGDSGFNNVENLGMPINSANIDRYFWLNEDGSEAYLVSNRPGSYYSDDKFETCCHDIYRLDIALECDMTVSASDCNTGNPVGGTVTITDITTGEEIYSGPLSTAGSVTATINRNNEYEITVNNECYPEKTINAGPFPDAEGDENCTTSVDMCLAGEAATLSPCTFDKKTGRELYGSEICLLDVAGGEQECKKTGAGHCGSFDVIIGKEYTLTGKKATYLDEVITFNADCNDLEPKIPMGKRPLNCMETLLPLSLYFDNDEPLARSKETYPETCDKYYSKKEEFKRRYISAYGFKSDERVIAEANVESFFENDLKRGCDNLDLAMNCVLEFLKNGENVTLELRGHASPLARDSYNEKLSQRRIDSIKSAMMAYNGGALTQYINSGQLTLIEKPFGESMSAEGVSDSSSRKTKSVYSPEASRERRVEIHRVISN